MRFVMLDILKQKHIAFGAAIVLQVALITGIILFKVTTLATGMEVLLRVEPVDPRDLLRGDYLALQYNISTISTQEVPVEYVPRTGTWVYVLLRPAENGYWIPWRVQTTKPKDSRFVFIKGRVVEKRKVGDGNRYTLLRIRYGIENYFIPEGRGSEFASLSRGKEILAKVVVDVNGNAILKQILIDGKPWPQNFRDDTSLYRVRTSRTIQVMN